MPDEVSRLGRICHTVEIVWNRDAIRRRLSAASHRFARLHADVRRDRSPGRETLNRSGDLPEHVI